MAASAAGVVSRPNSRLVIVPSAQTRLVRLCRSNGWGSLEIISQLIEDANQNLLDSVDFAVLPGATPIMQRPNSLRK
jgi:hypothetical protein